MANAPAGSLGPDLAHFACPWDMRSATNVAAYRTFLEGTFEQFCQDISAGAIVFGDVTLRDFLHHYIAKKESSSGSAPLRTSKTPHAILKNYYLHHEPTTIEKNEAILINEIASTLHLNEPEVANFSCRGADFAKPLGPARTFTARATKSTSNSWTLSSSPRRLHRISTWTTPLSTWQRPQAFLRTSASLLKLAENSRRPLKTSMRSGS